MNNVHGITDVLTILQAEFVTRQSLAGVMIWCLNNDDFNGTFCDGAKYPITRSIRGTFGLCFNSFCEMFSMITHLVTLKLSSSV